MWQQKKKEGCTVILDDGILNGEFINEPNNFLPEDWTQFPEDQTKRYFRRMVMNVRHRRPRVDGPKPPKYRVRKKKK